MADNDLKKRFDQTVRSISAEQAAWFDKTPARLGDYAGNVAVDSTSALVYIRLPNGQVEQALNTIVPDTWDWPVYVARNSIQPKLWQVISSQNVYIDFNTVLNGFLKYHEKQHEFDQPDMVPIDRRQITSFSLLVSDAVNWKVFFYGGLFQTLTAITLVPSQEYDLSAYVTTAGAYYLAFICNDAGTVTLQAGTNFGAPDAGGPAYVPVPPPGQYLIGYVIFYEGQTQLSNSDIRVITPLGVIPKSMGLQIDEAPAGTPIGADLWGYFDTVNGLLKSITQTNYEALLKAYFDTLYPTIDEFNRIPIGHVHGLARWTADGSTTSFDLPDVAEYLELVSDNGSVSDATTYSLSSDGSQLVFDAAPTSTHIIQASYVIATL